MLYLINSLLFLFLTWAWSSKDWLNEMLRFSLFLLCLANGAMSMYEFGFIIKVIGVK